VYYTLTRNVRRNEEIRGERRREEEEEEEYFE
jgi:hypothetical protein